jgi:hypothetical protein
MDNKKDKTLVEKVEKKMENKETSTAFILMFPTFILAVLTAYFAPAGIGIIGLAISIYSFIMIKKFISDYYNK